MGFDQMEAAVLLFFQNEVRGGFLNVVMTIITYMGEFGALWIVIGAVLVIRKSTRIGGANELIALGMTYLVNDQLIKRLVQRVRPYEVVSGLTTIIAEQGSTSFPSGHAATSFAAATALAMSFGWKGALAYIPAILISVSRIYVGVHYLTDVVAGAAIGIIMACWIVKRYRRILAKNLKEEAELKSARAASQMHYDYAQPEPDAQTPPASDDE